jgi:hypothetical protein
VRVLLGYIDPASGSLVIQLLVGGIAGVAAFARLRWSRLFNRRVPSERLTESTPEDSVGT